VGASVPFPWFRSARTKLIELVNAGTVNLALRGAKKDLALKELAGARDRCVTAFMTRQKKVRRGFKGQTVEAYIEEKKVDPRTVGETISWEWIDDEFVECVLWARQRKGSFEMDVEDLHGCAKEEVRAKSSTALRQKEIDIEFKNLTNKQTDRKALAAANVQVDVTGNDVVLALRGMGLAPGGSEPKVVEEKSDDEDNEKDGESEQNPSDSEGEDMSGIIGPQAKSAGKLSVKGKGREKKSGKGSSPSASSSGPNAKGPTPGKSHPKVSDNRLSIWKIEKWQILVMDGFVSYYRYT
jgi:hypothetical protein